MRLPLLLLLCVFTLILSAQSKQPREGRTHEIGLRLSGLENFDFIYKKSLSQDTYRRYRVFTSSATFFNLDGTSIGDFSVNAAIGKERRLPIADKLNFIRGPEYSAGLNLVGTDDNFQFLVVVGIGYVLGFTYQVSDKFFIGLETIPSVSIGYGNGSSQVVAFSAGFNSNAIALTAVYRFDK